MGGVIFVFTGDFRQTLPVIAKGTRADVIKVCHKSSQHQKKNSDYIQMVCFEKLGKYRYKKL